MEKGAKEEKMMTHGRAKCGDGEVSRGVGGRIEDSSSRSGGKKKRKDDAIGSFGGKKEGFGVQLSSDFYFFFPLKLNFTL